MTKKPAKAAAGLKEESLFLSTRTAADAALLRDTTPQVELTVPPFQ